MQINNSPERYFRDLNYPPTQSFSKPAVQSRDTWAPKQPSKVATPTKPNTPAKQACENCQRDGVSPVVYPNQKIVVPYSSLTEGMGGLEQMLVSPELLADILASVLPGHGIKVERFDKKKKLHLFGVGHAGVAVFTGKEERVYYYEYGRYSGPEGNVRISPKFGAFRACAYYAMVPSEAAMRSTAEALRKTNNAEGDDFLGVFVRTPPGTAKSMRNFAEEQMKNGRPTYSLESNHCMTFAIDVTANAGVDVSAARTGATLSLKSSDEGVIKQAINRHNSFVTRRAVANKLIPKARESMESMQLPALQIKELQKIYKDYNHEPYKLEGFPSKDLSGE